MDPSAVISVLFSQQPEDQAEHETDQDCGGDGQVEAKILPLDDDVTGEAPQAQPSQPGPGKADDDENHADDDQCS